MYSFPRLRRLLLDIAINALPSGGSRTLPGFGPIRASAFHGFPCFTGLIDRFAVHPAAVADPASILCFPSATPDAVDIMLAHVPPSLRYCRVFVPHAPGSQS